MALTQLIIAQTSDASSIAFTLTAGTNTIIVSDATMKDRVLLFLDGAPAGVIDRAPWAKTLVTAAGGVLTARTVNRSGNAITVGVRDGA